MGHKFVEGRAEITMPEGCSFQTAVVREQMAGDYFYITDLAKKGDDVRFAQEASARIFVSIDGVAVDRDGVLRMFDRWNSATLVQLQALIADVMGMGVKHDFFAKKTAKEETPTS